MRTRDASVTFCRLRIDSQSLSGKSYGHSRNEPAESIDPRAQWFHQASAPRLRRPPIQPRPAGPAGVLKDRLHRVSEVPNTSASTGESADFKARPERALAIAPPPERSR